MEIKIEKTIEVSLHEFGANLASANSDEQAQFFNAFAITLEGLCGGNHEMQIAYICDDKDHPMTNTTIEFFKSMVYFSEHKGE